MEKIFTIKSIIFGILFIAIDLYLFIDILSILLEYEQIYNQASGSFYSLESMMMTQKIAYVGFYVWWILQFSLLIMIGSKVYKYYASLSDRQIQY